MAPDARWLGLVLVLGVAGCARPDVDAYVRGLERLGVVVRDHGDVSCDQMGRAVARFMRTDHGAAIRDWSNRYHRLGRREREAVESPRYEARIERAMENLMPGFRRCHAEPSMKAAFADF